MSSGDNVEVKVPEVQVEKAVGALFGYLKAKQEKESNTSLFDVEEYFLISVTLRKIPTRTRRTPMRISIPNSIYHRQDVSIALVTKTQRESERRLEDYPVDNIKEIVSLKTLKDDMKAFQHRREFLGRHTLFFVDKNLYEVAVPYFGSKFTGQKSIIPVDIDAQDWRKGLSKARDSTYMLIKSGFNIAVRVGHSSQSRKEIVENVMAALPKIVEKIGNNKMIARIALHTDTSMLLPLWNQKATTETFAYTPEEKAEIDAMLARKRERMERQLAQKYDVPTKTIPVLRERAEAEGLNIKDLFKQYQQERQERAQLAELNKRQKQLEAMKQAIAELDESEKSEEEAEEESEEDEKKVNKKTKQEAKKNAQKVETKQQISSKSKPKKDEDSDLDNDNVDNLFFDDDDDDDDDADVALLRGGDSDDDDDEEEEEEEEVPVKSKGKSQKATPAKAVSSKASGSKSAPAASSKSSKKPAAAAAPAKAKKSKK